uniref:RIKEN cDNA 2310022B05 gene n=1 Tax=Mus spicilegus TaxID=10103 RepID=A0A8C6GS75_MUSSI
MASMAAAIAASRSAVMSGNRPLDDRERKRFTYFSSLSPMARKIMQDKEKIREKYGPEWARLPPAQQDEIIDRCLVGPRAPAAAADAGDVRDPARFPGLRGPTGQKLVRFGDEDITWQDEHSAPFSWETRSQMEFSISSLSIQEPSAATVTSDARSLAKAPQGTQGSKPAQSSRSSSLDALGPARKEEEASFWKINAERSREGPEAEFQSLTPSQIKSMEKGEKVLPACYRQEPTTKDREAKPVPQEQQTLPSVSVEQEVPQPVQAPASLLPKATPTESPEKPPPPAVQRDEDDDALFSEPALAQISSSNVLLKTGFDFLDNW